MTTPIQAIPAHDRPRERLLSKGAAALSDAELVAILLGHGSQGVNAIDLARSLLTEFGGLSGLRTARPVELARTPGVGEAKAARLCACFELGAREANPAGVVRLTSSADIAAVAQPRLGRERVERLVVLITDGGYRLLQVADVSLGGATASALPVREILAAVLRHDGVAFALAHNHPGGNPEPSAADRAATERVRTAATEVGLRFLDHVVVTDAAWLSISASR